MKKIVMIALVLIGTNVFAQPCPDYAKDHGRAMKEKMRDLTPEQRAALKTKQMVLDLDLTAAQQTEILKANEDFEVKMNALRKERESGTELSKDDLFAMKSQKLDNEINLKSQVKSILTKDQLAKWEKIRSRHIEHEPHRLKKKRP